jgi:hypothetical protein
VKAGGGPENYSVTLERGTGGTYLAWVDDLPGCAVRARSRAELLDRLPVAIAEFRAWSGVGAADAPPPRVTISEEVESAIEADEGTEVLVEIDRRPLTHPDGRLGIARP